MRDVYICPNGKELRTPSSEFFNSLRNFGRSRPGLRLRGWERVTALD
jgi:hypothetical protein